MTHTVTALADQASAAVHELACLTRPAITALDVHDLRTVTGALAELAAGLPQTLRQLSGYLTADALTAPSGPYTGDPDTAVAHAHTCLRQAAAAAAHLATALDAAHQTLGELAETTQTGPEGVNIQPTTRGQISTGVDISSVALSCHRWPIRCMRPGSVGRVGVPLARCPWVARPGSLRHAGPSTAFTGSLR
jgi:hypothetical protein